MLKIKTKLDELEELTSFNFFNFKSRNLNEKMLRSLIESILLEMNVPDCHEPKDKESSLYMYRLFRSSPDLYVVLNDDEFNQMLLNVYDVIYQEIRYNLKLSLSYSEIAFVLRALKKQ